MSLVAALLVTAQVGVGIAVNLYIVVPHHHPGSSGSDYFTRSADSVGWAASHAPLTLAAHTALGMLLVLVALVLGVRALVTRSGLPGALCVVGGLLVIGAALNGASFLDFGRVLSSLLMASLGLGALACYVLAACASGPDR